MKKNSLCVCLCVSVCIGVKKTFFSKNRFSCSGWQKKGLQSEKTIFIEKSTFEKPPLGGNGRGQKNIFFENRFSFSRC